jgi:hypothetical protein
MAITIRWLYLPNSGRNGRTDQQPGAASSDHSSPQPGVRAEPRIVMSCTILLVYFVLTFTHELSPYMLAVQLGALVVARVLRPRWLPFALAAIAAGYLAPQFSYVNSPLRPVETTGSEPGVEDDWPYRQQSIRPQSRGVRPLHPDRPQCQTGGEEWIRDVQPGAVRSRSRRRSSRLAQGARRDHCIP